MAILVDEISIAFSNITHEGVRFNPRTIYMGAKYPVYNISASVKLLNLCRMKIPLAKIGLNTKIELCMKH
jgi:hypothetical protein